MFHMEVVTLEVCASPHTTLPITNTHFRELFLLQTITLTQTYSPLSRYFHSSISV